MHLFYKVSQYIQDSDTESAKRNSFQYLHLCIYYEVDIFLYLYIFLEKGIIFSQLVILTQDCVHGSTCNNKAINNK